MIEALAGKALPRWPLLLLGAASLALFAIHQTYVSIVHPSALYMDSLRLLSHLYEWQHGRMSLLEIWGYGGSSHRGLITQLFLYANVKLLSLDVLTVNRITGVVVLALGFSIAVPYLRQNLRDPGLSSTRARWLLCYFAILFIALGYSPAGFELFTLDLGLPLWVKNFCFVAYFAAHAHLLRSPTLARSMTLTALAPVVVLVVGMGWSYAFVGTVVSVHFLAMILLGGPARTLSSVVPTLVVLVSGLLYVKGGGGAGDGVTGGMLFQKFPSAIWLACHSIGSTFLGSETGTRLGVSHWLPGLTGMGLILAMFVFLFQSIRRRTWSGTLLPLYLAGYGGLVALSVGYARGGGGFDAVMASRYYMDLYLFTVGAFWVWSEHALRQRDWLSVCLLVFAQALLFTGQMATQWVEWHTAPYRRVAIAAMNEATLNGVADEEDARLLQSPLPDARRGAAAMRNFGVGVFHNRVAGECADEGIRRQKGWYRVENGAVWMSGSAVLSVPRCECTTVASVYLPASFAEREIVVQEGELEVARINLTPGQTQTIRLPPTLRPSLFRVTASSVTVPKRDLGTADVRELSVLWTVPSFECAAPAARTP
ncbi:hypothetical protein [Pseudoxanthomonas sp. CF125]|uniref:hypothetical protein n=1 Tax=Pseudoxanthomonas sp. CF125 TaxID=1855303 RepID=UPI00088F6800|nr:hypothetical protein [Pseudoxanthomonas sp. CF125]SDQ88766.1 hypothetical protein SAMN05216569_2440 [Pseudoxanthomonas sp. CF125]